MSKRQGWIAASAVAIILTATLLPAQLLTSSGWWSALFGLSLRSCALILLYLAGIITVALISGFVLTRWLQRPEQASAAGNVERCIAVWLSLTGLSPLQPAAGTVVSLSLLSFLLGNGLQGNLSSFMLPGVAIILFGLSLGAEVSLRASEDDGRGLTERLRGLLAEVTPHLAGRLVMMVMFAVVISGVGMRWMQPHVRPISPDGRAIFGAVLVMFALGIVLWLIGRGPRLQGEETGGAHAGGTLARIGWPLVAIILLLSSTGAFVSPDPLRMDMGVRLSAPEGIMGSWGTDQLGRDLQARLFQVWQNAIVHGAAAGAFAIPIALRLRRGCSICSHIGEVAARIHPPILFAVGWGAVEP